MTSEAAVSQGPARAIDVISFNVVPFVVGPVAAVIATWIAVGPAPIGARAIFAAGAVIAAVLTIGAVVAIVWVFEWSADRRWRWVAAAAGHPVHWVNVTTGFDDSTDRLRHELGNAGLAVDVFDRSIDHDTALRRARRRFAPIGTSIAPAAIGTALTPGSMNAVFLLMSAHEAHGPDRQGLFGGAALSLRTGGRIVLVEHLRDLPNVLAFGPGAWHFQTRSTWLATAHDAGLALVAEAGLSPFVRGFVFEVER